MSDGMAQYKRQLDIFEMTKGIPLFVPVMSILAAEEGQCRIAGTSSIQSLTGGIFVGCVTRFPDDHCLQIPLRAGISSDCEHGERKKYHYASALSLSKNEYSFGQHLTLQVNIVYCWKRTYCAGAWIQISSCVYVEEQNLFYYERWQLNFGDMIDLKILLWITLLPAHDTVDSILQIALFTFGSDRRIRALFIRRSKIRFIGDHCHRWSTHQFEKIWSPITRCYFGVPRNYSIQFWCSPHNRPRATRLNLQGRVAGHQTQDVFIRRAEISFMAEHYRWIAWLQRDSAENTN